MPGVGLFLKQLRELGVKSAFFAADPAFLPDLITTAGPANAAGAIVSFQAPPYDANPKLVEVQRRLQEGLQRGSRPLFGLRLQRDWRSSSRR